MDGHKMESSGSSDIGNSISGGALISDSATTYVANTRLIETATDANTAVIVRVVIGVYPFLELSPQWTQTTSPIQVMFLVLNPPKELVSL